MRAPTSTHQPSRSQRGTAYQTLSRRSVLRGLGVCLSLPLLDAMRPIMARAAESKFRPWKSSTGVQPRMICCYVPNGVNIQQWLPPQTANAPTSPARPLTLSPTLQVLEAFQHEITLFSGLGHPASQGGHSGADTWLTGADLSAVPGSDYSNTVSLDQVVADHHGRFTRFPSLQLSDQSGTGSAGHSHTLSFDRAGTPLPAESSPRRLFERLFVPDTATDREATLQRYADKKSILDSVREESKALRRRLGTTDQRKLDEYFSSVRQTEQRVERLESWIDVPKPDVPDTDLQLASQPHNAHDRPMWLDVMLELSYLAFLTDTTRVITFEWSREAGGYGGGGENHHELSHHGGDPDMLAKLAKIDQFHLTRLRRFLDLLRSTEDGPGNMLDHTMVLYGSGMNSGEGGGHSPKNLPTLLAGGKRLGIRQGQHLAHNPNSHPPLNNLLLTMAQQMGIEQSTFGDATGTLTGLT